MDALAFAIMGITNIVCFVIGAKVGLAAKKGNDIELRLPSVNPIEHIRTSQTKKEARKEQDRLEAVMRNIEGYDGTSNGQRDIPRG
jgi:hypothetical protein